MRRAICLLFLLLPALAGATDFATLPRAQLLYSTLQSDYGFSAADLAWVRRALGEAKELPQLVQTEQNNKESTTTWETYEPISVNPANIAAGVRFMRAQHRWLAQAEADYGVPPQIVTAILGVETKYGSYTGKYRALDTLTTLGFEHPKRADFFMSELAQLFVLCRRERCDPAALHSSYAGALGDTQFMPSNVLRLGVDYDGDGRVDLWSPADAIGSIANYFAHFRPATAWRRGEPLFLRAAAGRPADNLPRNGKAADTSVGALTRAGLATGVHLPDDFPAGLIALPLQNGAEYWIGLPNFYSVLSYNPRTLYAAAVASLAEALVEADRTTPAGQP